MAATYRTRARASRSIDRLLFLGPASVLLVVFFIGPVLIDVVLAFTDMGRDLSVHGFTTANIQRMVTGDHTLTKVMATTAIFVISTLAFFNLGYALVLALVTTALPERAGAFFRALWLLPRMTPSVVYALLWSWVAAPTDYGLLNQILRTLGVAPVDLAGDHPMLLIVLANGFIGASMGMIVFTGAIKAIPEHLFHAARVDGAGSLSVVRHVTLPAIRWQLRFVTVYQALSLLVSFEYIWLITGGGPFYDTTVWALYVYNRAFSSGQYAYGAALSLGLVAIGVAAALLSWRFFDLRALVQKPRIEVG